ncbi:ClpXP protease specificity-enhancing factor [Candidatus Thiothrix sp. Deng01]|uniref:ClpXP protease specificity-enhancing factor n=1 Tax=Candidatus Thiothrix phosphatis TaxID=3112415 RepID=A0ABU6CZW8_9GAMM|nr:ClpXP protease specificity-enhancing factor [Candidatus Thiothrix sp. Deng01]MEB4592376.1 ClpXP protease specificity-enhancing factor [Candidatus Thiothrix sp. Deng01]
MNQSNQPIKMTPKRPYLLRAIYEWIVANGMTPHILVDARSDQVMVPRQFVKDGNIVLNVSMSATNNLMIRDDEVTFNARFGGKAFSIWLPMWSVMAIYSRETQDGISFPADEYAEHMDAFMSEASMSGPVSLAAISGNGVSDEMDGAEDKSSETTDQDEPPPTKPTKRPSLRVVK